MAAYWWVTYSIVSYKTSANMNFLQDSRIDVSARKAIPRRTHHGAMCDAQLLLDR